MDNTTLKYIPDRIGVLVGKGLATRPVNSVRTFPPNQHPDKCPIRADYTAVLVSTDMGIRWFGTEEAFIDSRLRMVIRVNMRDEVLARWEDYKA